MSHVFIVKPGQERQLPKVAAIAQRLKDEVLSIEQLSDEALCRICVQRSADTDEHAPSKSAGNRGRVLHGRVNYEQSVASGRLTWEVEQAQRIVFRTLCGTCNNNSGSWYNPAYVTFSKHCASLAIPEHAGRLCEVKLWTNPQRVLKQALASLLAVSQPGLTVKYPHLRDLIVRREATAPLAPCHLWLYLRANRGGRSSGLGFRLEFVSGTGQLVAEFSFWPLGWLLTLDGTPVPGAVDVSAWSAVGFHEKRDLALALPCQWAVSPYPADFKSPSDVKQSLGGDPPSTSS